ncbi:putative L-galactonate transporter [Candidatus Rhabdochlamydia oedothoracis]|uniref:Lysosomal dipeptide transporter MFSD1 n=1 Tax=Candidatus Rhabdochlamydia oedothoracis TaxID=2720720 RepID=A0ABX8UZD7_9BACT|nr:MULTISPECIES: MFS transporter [Rhabdochlamydia]KAG6558647.1 putative L-galactonate transporter [Candidatus Rhabdochlamydia sp. W815]QYF47986.1 putative L-galactonate transporter [Candidatus Rhabdochlamydia oedothoracis]
MAKMTHEKLTYPIRAWTIWLLSAIFMFYKYAIEVSPSVMTGTLMKAFDISGVELGNLAASYFYAYLLLQIPAGLLLDKFGPRKTTTIAIFLCAVGNLIFARADSLIWAGTGRFLTGIGAAFAVVNCLKLIANWFPFRQFAFMAGLMMTVAMLGAVGGQAPLAVFIQKVEWRYAIELIGIAGLILAVVFWIVVQDKAPDHKREKHIVPSRPSFFDNIKQIFQNPQSWWLSIYSGFAFAPVMVFGGLWGVSFIMEAFELTHQSSAQMVSLIFIGFSIGAPFFGWFSDWLGRRRIVMLWGTALALIAISTVIYVSGSSVCLLGFLLFVFGFSISSFLLCFTMIREVNLPILAATAIGFMNAFDALLGALSDPLTGKFLDLHWDGKLVEGARVFSIDAYQTVFLTLPIYLLISLFTLLKIKETHCKPSYIVI